MASFVIVDDSHLARMMLKTSLIEMGHTVIGEGSDGKEGVAEYDEKKPDVITLDLEMPNLNGIEAAEIILRNNPTAKIILITSVTNKREINIAKKRGVKGVLFKPFENKELREVVEGVLV